MMNMASLFSLMRRSKVSVVVALLLSIVIGVGPFVMGHIYAGHINFLILFPLLEAIFGIHILLFGNREEIRNLTVIRYLAALVLLPFTNLYYLYFFGLVAVFYSITYVWITFRNQQGSHGNFRGLLHRALSRPCTVFILTLFGCAPAIPHLFDVAALALSRTYTRDHNPGAHAASLLQYLSPSPLQQFYSVWETFLPLPAPSLHVGESALYVPYSLLLLGGFFLMRRPAYCLGHKRHLLLAIIFFLVSFGPNVTIYNNVIIPNPIDWLFRAMFPLFPSVPARFGGLASLFFILYVAGCTVQSTKREYCLLVAPLLILACVEIFPVQIIPHQLQDFTGLRELMTKSVNREAINGVVVDISVPAQSAMYRQTFHERMMVGGFLSRRPKQMERILRRNSFARFIRGEGEFTNEELVRAWCSLGGEILLMPLNPSNSQANVRLEQLGFSVIGSADDFGVLKRTAFACPLQ
jgi:hypothetical protein